MRRLHFPLEGLREVRLIQQRVAEARLAQAVGSLRLCDQSIEDLHDRLGKIAQSMAGQSAGALVGDPVSWARQVEFLGARIDVANKERVRLDRLVKECEALRVQAEIETEKIQVLKNQAVAAWKKEMGKQTQAQMEERLLARWYQDQLDHPLERQEPGGGER